MKKLLFLLLALSAQQLIGQDISGKWYGALSVGAAKLRLTLDLTKNDTGYTGKMTSVDQGNATMPLQYVRQDGNSVAFKASVGGITYAGTNEGAQIRGTFSQGGQNFPLVFGRTPIDNAPPKRPQEPKEPFPYISEELTFNNVKDSITLAGTLTLPSSGSKFPVVVLISGSGPQNRNEELMGHKPFLVLADHLTRNGIAVLRYDDRGTGRSKGNFNAATSADFANDVEAAVAYLKTRKEIDPKKIGLIGHSEGGLIAPMVAARNRDVSYIVLMAGPGVKGQDVLVLQVELLARAEGVPADEARKQAQQMKELTDIATMKGDTAVTNAAFRAYVSHAYRQLPDSVKKQATEAQYTVQYARLNSPWMKYFLSYDPATSLSKVKVPVLALNGSKDLQVYASQNLPRIGENLKKAGNSKFMLKELPGLNHLFQECLTGASSEYAQIEQTLSPSLLSAITEFLLKATVTR